MVGRTQIASHELLTTMQGSDELLGNREGATKRINPKMERVLVKVDSSQTIASGSLTNVIWDSAAYDVGSMWDASSEEAVLCPRPGIVFARLGTRWTDNTSGHRESVITVNNSEVFPGVGRSSVAATGGTNDQSVLAGPISVNSGDLLRAKVKQDSGGNLDLTRSTTFSVWYME